MATYGTSCSRLGNRGVPKVNKMMSELIGRGAPISVPTRTPPTTGNGRIYGFTKIKGSVSDTPARERVVCTRVIDNQYIKEVLSDPVTGAFSVDNLNPAYTYMLTVYDINGVYDPETRGPLTTVPMP